MRSYYRRMSTDGPLRAAVFTEIEVDEAEVRWGGVGGGGGWGVHGLPGSLSAATAGGGRRVQGWARD